jgi:putative solute:sodium symporter small subunit
MPDPNLQSHRRRTKNLMLVMLGLWVCFFVVVPLFMVPLNRLSIPYLDLPLGFFMGAQGALIAFVLLTFWFAKRQDRIDRDHFVDRKGRGGMLP